MCRRQRIGQPVGAQQSFLGFVALLPRGFDVHQEVVVTGEFLHGFPSLSDALDEVFAVSVCRLFCQPLCEQVATTDGDGAADALEERVLAKEIQVEGEGVGGVDIVFALVEATVVAVEVAGLTLVGGYQPLLSLDVVAVAAVGAADQQIADEEHGSQECVQRLGLVGHGACHHAGGSEKHADLCHGEPLALVSETGQLLLQESGVLF